MRVFVKLYALLRQHHPGPDRSQPIALDVPEGATVADLAPALGLKVELVRSAFVNNEAHGADWSLKDGDHVGLFPPVVGGTH